MNGERADTRIKSSQINYFRLDSTVLLLMVASLGTALFLH